jgi:hypothetical protein
MTEKSKDVPPPRLPRHPSPLAGVRAITPAHSRMHIKAVFLISTTITSAATPSATNSLNDQLKIPTAWTASVDFFDKKTFGKRECCKICTLHDPFLMFFACQK